MARPFGCSLGLLSLLLASSAPAVSFDWALVGNPGNACDTQSAGCFGSVAYVYEIATTEVTIAQYAEFLNAVAKDDVNALYHTNMNSTNSGITRSGTAGSYSYAVIAGRADMPVNNVSFFDAMRFANWLQNGQLAGAQDATTTEDGAYTLLGTNPAQVFRNASASIVLPSEDEWYKAAYYAPGSATYFDYPAGYDLQTVCQQPLGLPNTANCSNNHLEPVGSYTAAASPYGTFDQGGNVFEWTETYEPEISGGYTNVMRGGMYLNAPSQLAASARIGNFATLQQDWLGLRVVRVTPVPEPGTGLLALLGLAALGRWRRA